MVEIASPPVRPPVKDQAIHVCVVNTSPFVFGAEKSMAYAVRRMLENGSVRFSLISPGGDTERLFRDVGVTETVSVRLTRLGRTANPFSLLRQGAAWVAGTRRVHEAIRSLQPDIVHANGIHSLLYVMLAKRLSRLPVVWHVRDAPRNDLVLRACVNAADVLVVPSESMRPALAHLKQPIHRVANPISLKEESPALLPADTGSRPFRIALVGQMIARKGHVTLLDALPRVLARVPDIEVWFVGSDPFDPDSPYVREIEDRVSRSREMSNRVRFLGYVTDMTSVYGSVDSVAIPSSQEPFGRVALEAMGYGCPVIASRTGGLAETVSDGTNALLFDPGDSIALADRIISLARSSELRDTLRRNGRETYARHEEEVAEGIARLCSIYRDLA